MKVLRDALRLFSNKGARLLAAGVAYYALLSAAPLLVVILSVVGAVFGRARAESALWDGLALWIAPDGLATFREMTERLDGMGQSGGLIGAALVVYGSTRLFRALRQAINQLWGIDVEGVERGRTRVKRYGVRYGGALLLTLLTACLVAILMLVKATFATIASVSTRSPPALLWGLDALASVGLTFVLFGAMFRFLPETRVTWREAALSAFVSTLLFAAGSGLVSLYVGHKQLSTLYAGASAVVLAVLWVYYSTQVFFFGACVGAALHGRSGASAEPQIATNVRQ